MLILAVKLAFVKLDLCGWSNESPYINAFYRTLSIGYFMRFVL